MRAAGLQLSLNADRAAYRAGDRVQLVAAVHADADGGAAERQLQSARGQPTPRPRPYNLLRAGTVEA